MNLAESVDQFVRDRSDYYRQWLFDEPLLLPMSEIERFRRLQHLLHKVIVRFVTHYNRYHDLMPVSPAVEEILEIFSQRGYQVGTFRTDFISDRQGVSRIIEITCRFALNGYFFSAVFNQFAAAWLSTNQPFAVPADLFTAIYERYDKLLFPERNVVVLKGEETRNESKLFTPILQRAGVIVTAVKPDEVLHHRRLIERSLVVNELNFDEIVRMPRDAWILLANSRILNDFRTIFLIHDKRFFGVMRHPRLLHEALNDEEADELMRHCVRNITEAAPPEVWEEALAQKDLWVLKPRALGKSAEVQVGRVLTQSEWLQSARARPRRDLVLQEWIDRPLHRGAVSGVHHEDHAVGTALFWDQDFYGLGEYRTSSHPVTGKAEHRKLAAAFV